MKDSLPPQTASNDSASNDSASNDSASNDSASNDSAPNDSGPRAPERSAPRKWLQRVIDVAIGIAVLVALGFAFLPRKASALVGTPAKELELSVIAAKADLPLAPGHVAEKRALLGKRERPLLIEAFASWCGACKRSGDLMEDLKIASDEGKLDVVAVSVDDSERQAQAAKDQWPIPLDVLHDTSGAFSRAYKVDLLPTYILVGTDGSIKRVTSGVAGAADLRAWFSAAD